MEVSEERLRIQKKIAEYERKGLFDRDVENDPPTRPLSEGEADYLYQKKSSRIKMVIANRVARFYFDRKIRKGELVIRRIEGIEHYLSLQKTGALLTCNHFNPYDNYAVYKAIQPYLGKKQLFKIIREGNYTSFPGLYGFFFRHCNTLPLASKLSAMKEMMASVNILLKRGEKVLIYPEQGMWWNYRKPRPLKSGAFRFAVKADVPILPIFITLTETETIGKDGFPILAYTIHFLSPIYPDPSLSVRENAEKMAVENYEAWKKVYEEFYKIPLTYTTEGEVKPCCI